MKTTIDIPEPLYRQAKIRVVEQGTSLKALVWQELEQALSSAGAVTPEVPYFAGRKLNVEFQALMGSGVIRPRPEDREVTDLIAEDRNRDIS